MTFADKDLALKIVKELHPESTNITVIEHGYDHLVVTVDQKFVFRFPKNTNALARSQYERDVLKDLESVTVVPIPKVLDAHDDPSYVIVSFLKGDHLTRDQILELPEDKQIKLGEDLAAFAYAMHSTLSVEKALDMRDQYHLDELHEEPWNIYFERLLANSQILTETQNKLAQDYFVKWRDLQFTTPLVVVHDDLHNQNLLLENGNLSGVVDFGDTNIGHPEQEFRQLYRLNETIMMAAVHKYQQLSGWMLNVEAIIVWAITHEMATLVEHLTKNDTAHPAYERSVLNLNRWLPEGHWEKIN